MNAYWYSIQWGFKPQLNKVKAPGGCHRFSEEIYRAKLDKIWAQIGQGAFDLDPLNFNFIKKADGYTAALCLFQAIFKCTKHPVFLLIICVLPDHFKKHA
ncbi:hypothetical protein [Siminovitchia terrae]|uniref:hypothetical protein n=1 Tax=Siminovitchia terrae TaxID=1914933 RepID=UPI0028ACDBC3|nr:hypothetical protein [Siminovitchia terrae]